MISVGSRNVAYSGNFSEIQFIRLIRKSRSIPGGYHGPLVLSKNLELFRTFQFLKRFVIVISNPQWSGEVQAQKGPVFFAVSANHLYVAV